MATRTGDGREPGCPAGARPGESERAWPGGRWWHADTRDPDHGARLLQRAYGVQRFRVLQEGPFDLALGIHRLEGMSVERTRCAEVIAEFSAQGTAAVRVVKALSGRLAVGCGPRRIEGTGPWLLPTAAHTVRWSDPDLLSICLELAALQERAAAWLGLEEFGLRFHSGKPVSAAMAEYMTRMIVVAGRDQVPNAQAMAHRLVRAQVFDQLAAAVLHTYPGTFLDHRCESAHESPVPAAVHRAVAFMEEHLGEALTVAQIAAAARMSPRGLQASFRRGLATTPMAHLRSLRLEAAHTDLLAADPATTTVAEIAAHWGFTHPSRFAAAYRQRYGHNPVSALAA